HRRPADREQPGRDDQRVEDAAQPAVPRPLLAPADGEAQGGEDAERQGGEEPGVGGRGEGHLVVADELVPRPHRLTGSPRRGGEPHQRPGAAGPSTMTAGGDPAGPRGDPGGAEVGEVLDAAGDGRTAGAEGEPDGAAPPTCPDRDAEP